MFEGAAGCSLVEPRQRRREPIQEAGVPERVCFEAMAKSQCGPERRRDALAILISVGIAGALQRMRGAKIPVIRGADF